MFNSIYNYSLICCCIHVYGCQTWFTGARGGVVGSGTMLQAERSRVRFRMRSLDFSIDLIHPQPLTEMSTRRGADNPTAICVPIV
jgi:hypothetical protein